MKNRSDLTDRCRIPTERNPIAIIWIQQDPTSRGPPGRIRHELKLPKGINYSLIDLHDNAIVEISSLRHLDHDSNVLIKPENDQNLSTSSSMN